MTMTLEQIEQNATAGPWKIVRSPEEAYDSTADVVRIEIYQLSDESETSPIANELPANLYLTAGMKRPVELDNSTVGQAEVTP